ncbi:multicopper oxidase family protein [Actinomadura sp. HBU206391]|uniref:multicopper oxidase family protein n=1 Tax=Actinomadura sp. HBU206391 TaxID=2731692 RepID=UPI001C9C550D|nr:multicopper oxidase family protein [Actinomadura sp. HBU206391]
MAVIAGCDVGETPLVRKAAEVPKGAPLRDPPQYVSGDGVLRVRIVVERRQIRLAGRTLWALTYNGYYMPPTLRLQPGDRMDFTMVNNVRPLTNLHVHGLQAVPVRRPEDVFLHIQPGETFHHVFRFPRTLSPGTYWYHSYAQPALASEVMDGMSGIIVIDGLRRHLPPGLRKITEHVIALKDVRGQAGAARGHGVRGGPSIGSAVNGQINPIIRLRPGETQLWRLANISSGNYYRLRLRGQRFQVIAQDAHPVERIWSADSLLIPAGARYDVLVEGGRPGRTELETLPYNAGPDAARFPQGVLATAVSAGIPVQCAALPVTFASMRDLSRVPIAAHHTLVFSRDKSANPFFAMGRYFNPKRVDIRSRLGTVEEWTVRNPTDAQQAFHVHTNGFQVMSVNGRPHVAHSWQDTVNLPERGHVVIRLRFAGHPGKTVFHCAMRSHEDMGMMAVLQIVK